MLGKRLYFCVLVLTAYACGNQQKDGEGVSQQMAIFAAGKGEKVVAEIVQTAKPIALHTLVEDSSLAMPEALKAQIVALPGYEDMEVSIPVEAHRGQLAGHQEALWLYVPDVDEEDLKEATAFDAQGAPVLLDMHNAPDRPVITIARNERRFLEEAQAEGRVRTLSERDLGSAEVVDRTNGEQLRTVGFRDVQEPWAKGDAEIYAIVTFIDREGKGGSEVVPLEGVVAAQTIYNPNKILHYWASNKYQIVDVSFYEHDSQYNYKELGKILLNAAAAVSIASNPEAVVPINLLKTVLTSVVDAIPDDPLTDTDDYLDVINTIQKYQDAQKILITGVSGNFGGTLSTFSVKLSDE